MKTGPFAEGECGYNSAAGMALAKIAATRHGATGPQGACLRGASESVSEWSGGMIDLRVSPPHGAKQAAKEAFENPKNFVSEWFAPVRVSREDISQGHLPPGAIIVYSDPVSGAWPHTGGCGRYFPDQNCFDVVTKYGHIDVVGPDGLTGYSDGKERLTRALRQFSTLHIYVPNGRQQGELSPPPGVDASRCGGTPLN